VLSVVFQFTDSIAVHLRRDRQWQKRTKLLTMIPKTLHRTLKIDQTNKRLNSTAPEGDAIPALLVPLLVILLIKMKNGKS
jgi:hypothetical protein